MHKRTYTYTPRQTDIYMVRVNPTHIYLCLSGCIYICIYIYIYLYTQMYTLLFVLLS